MPTSPTGITLQNVKDGQRGARGVVTDFGGPRQERHRLRTSARWSDVDACCWFVCACVCQEGTVSPRPHIRKMPYEPLGWNSRLGRFTEAKRYAVTRQEEEDKLLPFDLCESCLYLDAVAPEFGLGLALRQDCLDTLCSLFFAAARRLRPISSTQAIGCWRRLVSFRETCVTPCSPSC